MNSITQTENTERLYCNNISAPFCMQIGSTSGTVVGGTAQCIGASYKTAFIAGISTAGCIWLTGILASIYCCIYNNKDDTITDDCQNEAFEPAAVVSLLTDTSNEEARADNSDKTYLANRLVASYGTAPAQDHSSYETNEPKLGTINTTLQC